MVGLIVVIVTCCILTVSVQQGNVTANASVTPVAPPLAANVAVAAVPLQDPPARQQRFPPAVASLPALLRIDWRRLPDLPKQGPLHQGFQDSDGAVVDKGATLITAFGYAGGGVPGFLNGGFAINTSASSPVWAALPKAPISGRQEVSATRLPDNSLVFLGGFSYVAPYTFADVVRLRRRGGVWAWDTDLPDFPYPVQSAGVASISDTVFVLGGCDYDRTQFYCSTDRHGGNPGMGRRLWSLEIPTTTAGSERGAEWVELPMLPALPRWVHSFTAVQGKLYVLGGARTDVDTCHTGSNTSSTVGLVDCWCYDPATRTWVRLPDMPFSSSNWQTNGPHAFMDRYIILVGGNQYSTAASTNGETAIMLADFTRHDSHQDWCVYLRRGFRPRQRSVCILWSLTHVHQPRRTWMQAPAADRSGLPTRCAPIHVTPHPGFPAGVAK
eukprot:m.65389 g.65389  ORF g.65389 m.65389 type:complete len:441 (-) comp17979_c0_seq2:748-2070(-)